MKIYLGTDHAGYEMKEALKEFLGGLSHEVADLGALALEPGDDYPDFIGPVAVAVAREEGSMGIVLGGSGQGEAMCANRTKGVRTAVFYGGPMEIVRLSREHNDANILSLGARFMTLEDAKTAVQTFIETQFSGEERHVRRIAKLD
jgi:ribose 5-phosphate isomerase B